MKQSMRADLQHAPSCDDGMEEWLNLFVDGELPFEDQSTLFSHLAVCETCRCTFAAVMAFRRISREEKLSVPSSVDDSFFRRLDDVKRRTDRVDRAADRRPLWQARASVSLRVATMAAVFLFIAGLLLPVKSDVPISQNYVEGLEERVEFSDPAWYWGETLYVFYPGLTVEAPMPPELKVQESL